MGSDQTERSFMSCLMSRSIASTRYQYLVPVPGTHLPYKNITKKLETHPYSVEDLYKGPIICTGRQYAGTAIWYQLLSLPVPSLLNLVQTRVLPRILPLNLTDSFSSKIFDPRYFTESVSHSCWTMPRAIYATSQFASQIGGADGAARHR